MLLGPGGAGKTSLKRGLMGQPFDPRTNSTIVADIQSNIFVARHLHFSAFIFLAILWKIANSAIFPAIQ